jgi:threonine dehydratase
MHASVIAGRVLPEGGYRDEATLSDGTAGGIEDGAATFEACRYAATSVGGVAALLDAARARCAGAAGGAGAAAVAAADAPGAGAGTRRLVDGLLTVPEADIEAAMLFMADVHHKLVEGAAGTGIALLRSHAALFAGCDVVIVLCGSNVALSRFRELLAKHPQPAGAAAAAPSPASPVPESQAVP